MCDNVLMITILHGDHIVKISEEISKKIQEAKTKGVEVLRLPGKSLTIADLETALGTSALFAVQKLVVIDGLFSLPRSKKKDQLIQWIREHEKQEIELCLLEKKTLTASQQKLLPKAVSKIFKYPSVLFAWLESLGAVSSSQSLKLFQEVIEREDVEFAFVMLVRHVRILLSFVSDNYFEGPPFLRSKVASQARHFSKERLLSLHKDLLDLDEKQKTSLLVMPLSANLDLILSEL